MVSWFRRDSKEPSPSTPVAVHGPLEMHRPWARAAHDPLQGSTAGAFLSVTNRGPADDRLIAASSPAAEHVELHGIKVVGAGIDMRPLAKGLAVQAGYTMTLKPRGYHLLLQGVKAPLLKGSTLPITLTFERAGPVAVEFAVEDPGPIGKDVLSEEPHHRG